MKEDRMYSQVASVSIPRIFLCGVAILVLILASVNGSDSASACSDLGGKKMAGMDYSKVDRNRALESHGIRPQDPRIAVEFFKDKTFIWTQGGPTVSGKWNCMENDRVKMDFQGLGTTFAVIGKLKSHPNGTILAGNTFNEYGKTYFELHLPNDRAVPDLLNKALTEKDAWEALLAENLLAIIGPAAISALSEALKGEDHHSAGQSLCRMAQDGSHAALTALAGALGNPNDDVRLNAASCLAGLGPAAGDAVPELVKALRDNNQDVRGNALAALAEIGPSAKPAISELRRLIEEGKLPRGVSREVVEKIIQHIEGR